MNIAGAIEYLSAGLSPVTDEHLTEARLAVSDMAEIPYNRLNKYKASTFPAALMPRLEELVSRRKSGEPLQYILGKWEFMGLPFYTRPCALIPRQDTETLVEQVLKIVKPGMKVLDLCTGSGCVLISVLKNAPELTGMGSDISKTALLVAKENAKLHEVDAEWVRSDLFDNITETFDVIMANPPYIPTGEILSLMPEVRDFEPENALDGGADGLDFYRKIAGQVKDYLNPGGYVYMEIGYDQGEAVSELMRNAGFTEVEVIKDLARNDRVVKGKGN